MNSLHSHSLDEYSLNEAKIIVGDTENLRFSQHDQL